MFFRGLWPSSFDYKAESRWKTNTQESSTLSFFVQSTFLQLSADRIGNVSTLRYTSAAVNLFVGVRVLDPAFYVNALLIAHLGQGRRRRHRGSVRHSRLRSFNFKFWSWMLLTLNSIRDGKKKTQNKKRFSSDFLFSNEDSRCAESDNENNKNCVGTRAESFFSMTHTNKCLALPSASHVTRVLGIVDPLSQLGRRISNCYFSFQKEEERQIQLQ